MIERHERREQHKGEHRGRSAAAQRGQRRVSHEGEVEDHDPEHGERHERLGDEFGRALDEAEEEAQTYGHGGDGGERGGERTVPREGAAHRGIAADDGRLVQPRVRGGRFVMDGHHGGCLQTVGQDRLPPRIKGEIEIDPFGRRLVLLRVSRIIAVSDKVVITDGADARRQKAVHVHVARRPHGGQMQGEVPAVVAEEPVLERGGVRRKGGGGGVEIQKHDNVCTAACRLRRFPERDGRALDLQTGLQKDVRGKICGAERRAFVQIEDGDRRNGRAVRSRDALRKGRRLDAGDGVGDGKGEHQRGDGAAYHRQKAAQDCVFHSVPSAGKE